MMWDVPLYMCCFYWLMNKTVWANGLAEKSQVGYQNRGRERKRDRWSQRDAMQLLKETHTVTLPSKPQPRGDTQNN